MNETTSHDLIEQAKELAKTDIKNESIRELLARARTLCERPYSYTRVADAYLELLQDHKQAEVCYEEAIHGSPEDPGPYCSWASMAGNAGNLEKASAVLKSGWEYAKTIEGFDALRLFIGLSNTYFHVCEDATTAQNVLQDAKKQAQSVGSFCDLIEANLLCGASDSIIQELQKEAFRIIERNIDEERQDIVVEDYCSLAFTHQNVAGDAEASQNLFQRALEHANTTEQILLVAFNWHLLFEEQIGPLNQMFQQAQKRAHTFEDWLKLAQRAKEQSRGKDEIREYLEEALKKSVALEQKKKVAQGFRLWINMPQRASEIVYAGLHPKDIAISKGLDNFESSPNALFDCLHKQITSEDLQKIANADWGCDYDEHLIRLTNIQNTGLLPIPIDGFLGEVLSLSRWATGKKLRHRTRAFACTILYLDSGHPKSNFETYDIIPNMLASAIQLYREVVQHLQALMVWRFGIEHSPTWRQPNVDSFIGICLCELYLNPSSERLSFLIEQLSALIINDLKRKKTEWDEEYAGEEGYAPSSYQAQSPKEWIWEKMDCGVQGLEWKNLCNFILAEAKKEVGSTKEIQYFESIFPDPETEESHSL